MAVLGGTNFNLLSDTERDTYNSVKFATIAARTAGDMVLHEDIVGVFVRTYTSGDDGVLVYEASKIVVPCVAITSGATGDYTVGSRVYFDATNAEVTATAAANTLCGIVTTAGASGDETIEIHLMGALGIVA